MDYSEHTLGFLTSILVSLGLTVAGRAIIVEGEDGAEDVYVGDKRFVMPTPETLKVSEWDKEIAFSPLSENTLRGESEVQQELAIMVKSAINGRLVGLIWNLALVAASEQCVNNKLSPEQAEFLPSLPGFDKEMKTRFGKLVIGVTAESYKSSMVHLNLKRRAKINGQEFSRACLVRFPLAEMERKDKPFGVDLRVKDMDALQSLMDYILPDWTVENAYSRGTDSKVAPYFVALMLAYQNINARITEIAKLFVKDFPKFGLLINEDPWVAQMDNLARMRDSIPTLPGNEGSVAKNAPQEAPQIHEPAAARSIPNQPAAAPAKVGSLPWEDQGAQPEPAAQPARMVDADAVEYVPRTHSVPMAPQWNQPQQPLVPAGYGNNQPQPGQPLTFAQMEQQRLQQQNGGFSGFNNPASFAPSVGGSPFAGGGNTAGYTAPAAGVAYVSAQPVNHNPQPVGRGF